ncbi:MAG: hypothetical protein Q3990_09585 [Desulfovibrionaceae bacterium]|nr:hypothetical protein [Desulfovibrionaceae bacterium]
MNNSISKGRICSLCMAAMLLFSALLLSSCSSVDVKAQGQVVTGVSVGSR